jgi:hypothetical protein
MSHSSVHATRSSTHKPPLHMIPPSNGLSHAVTSIDLDLLPGWPYEDLPRKLIAADCRIRECRPHITSRIPNYQRTVRFTSLDHKQST